MPDDDRGRVDDGGHAPSQAKPRQRDVVSFFLRPHLAPLGVLAALAVITGLLEIFAVASIFPLVSSALDADAPASGSLAFIWWMVDLVPMEPVLARVGILFSALILTVTILRIAHASLMYHLASTVVRETTAAALDKLLASDYEYFVRARRGDLIYRVWEAPHDIAYLFYVVSTLAFALVVSALLLPFLALLSWQATAAVVLVGALYYRWVGRLAKERLYRLGQERTAAGEGQTSVLAEAIDGIRHVKAYQMEDVIRHAHRHHVTAFWRGWAQINFLSPLPGQLLRAFLFTVLGLALAVLAVTNPSGVQGSLALYATVGFGYLRLAPMLSQMSELRLRAAAVLPSLEVVHAVLHEPAPRVRDGARQVPGFEREVRFEGVGFRHREGALVLQGFSATLPKNRTTALVGPSGAGKSTVVDLLLRLYDPQDGAITVDGADLRGFTLASWRSRIGLVSQDPFIAHASVEENIRYGMRAAKRDDIVAAARQAHALEFIEALPQGFGTILGDRGVRLSGGQKQRIAIARALLRRPSLLILDEATSSLDNISEMQVQQALRDIAPSTTVLVVAHRLSTVRDADKIVVLQNGVNAEEGSHDELVARRGAYWNLLQAQREAPTVPILAAEP